jgi:hypothetical protein
MRRAIMEMWKTILLSLHLKNPKQTSDLVSLGTRRAVVTFILIMGTAVLLVVGISKVLR